MSQTAAGGKKHLTRTLTSEKKILKKGLRLRASEKLRRSKVIPCKPY